MLEGSFLSHLVELRTRLIRALGGLMLGFLPCAFYARELYTLLAQPLLEKLPQGGQMIATDVATPFFVPMKVAMMMAFVITLPHTLYQIWAFVAPGLYSHEKRLALPLVFGSSFLFFCGMAFAYFAALPLVFEFITYFAPEGVAVMTDRKIPEFCFIHVSRFWRHFRSTGICHYLSQNRRHYNREIKRNSLLRHRRSICHCSHIHSS